MRASDGERHISGAEGIVTEEDINGQALAFIKRAFNHTRGNVSSVNVKIDKLEREPLSVKPLPLYTVNANNSVQAFEAVTLLLNYLSVPDEAKERAFDLISNEHEMRGAAFLHYKTGERLDHEKSRGVRVTNFGMTEKAWGILSKKLEYYVPDPPRTRDALLVASKTATCRDIIAELCVSDNPDYTTGYIASGELGYIRVPNIKKRGELQGGRVFFLIDDASLTSTVHYLESTPVMVDEIPECHGPVSIDELISLFGRLGV